MRASTPNRPRALIESSRPVGVERFLPPLLVWLAALSLLWLVAGLAGFAPWHARTWARWDSNLYEDIARHGYTLRDCSATAASATWCGNAGWFPGYPWLIAAVSRIGLPVAGVAVSVSWLFAGATLSLVWLGLLGGKPTVRSFVALAFAGFAPGLIYDYAVYPISMLTFFTVAFLLLLHRCRFALAGLAGAGAVLAYPVGLVLVVVAVCWVPLTLERGRIRAVALSAAGPMLAFLTVLLVERLETGAWDAYFKVQRKYGHGLHEPLGQIWNVLVPLTRGNPFARGNAPALQTLLVAVVLVLVLVQLALRRRSATRLDLLLALWAVWTWVLPLTATHISVWRSEATLLPAAVLVARLPGAVAAVVTAAALAVSVPVALLYFHGQLV